jgi:hypothetical protein
MKTFTPAAMFADSRPPVVAPRPRLVASIPPASKEARMNNVLGNYN